MTRTESILISVMTRIGAALLGVIPAFVVLLTLFSDTPGLNSFSSFVWYALGQVVIVAALQGAFGVAFGLAFPRSGWRWGIWLNVPILLLLILFLPIFLSNMAMGDVDFRSTQTIVEDFLLFGLFAGPPLAACLGAYAGARARRHFSSEQE